MSVRRATAYALLKVFATLEFELKNVPGLIGSSRRNAQVNWPAVDRLVRALPVHAFLDNVSMTTKRKMLAPPRDRPMIHEAVLVGGINHAVFRRRDLPLNDAEALVVATRRVRNNLFHGGKEDPLQEAYKGDDQEWATAAHEVATMLLTLVRAAQIAPP